MTDSLAARLRDHENEGVTASDRFHLRNEAADRIEELESQLERAASAGPWPTDIKGLQALRARIDMELHHLVCGDQSIGVGYTREEP